MNISSPRLLNTNTALNKNNPHAVYEKESGGYHFSIVNIEDAIWIIAAWPKGSRIAFRLAYSPNDHLEIKKITEDPNRIIINIGSLMVKQQISIQLPHQK